MHWHPSDIEAGKHVALVGPSGTGKSTVVNLLLCQWDPQEGTIRIVDRPQMRLD